MIRFVVYCLFAVFAVFSASADRLLVQNDEKTAISVINSRASKIKSINTKFKQVKSLSLLKDEIMAEGVLKYFAPSKLHWEYTSPYKYTFEMDGDKVTITTSKGKNTMDASTSKIFKGVADIIMQTVTGKCLGPGSRFNSKIYATTDGYRVLLTPKSKQMMAMFKNVTLYIPGKTDNILPVSKIIITEKNNDTTTITFNLQK